jgi:cytochrome b
LSNLVRVWDLPTRFFHWALVLCVISLFVTAKIGGAAMAWHFRFGYCVLVLLLFRLCWGFVGGHWSRFSTFLHSPSGVIRYLRGQGTPDLGIGHNPLGAGSVLAMLFFLLLQVASGLISDDEIAASGPFTSLVPGAWVSRATFYHADVGQFVLITLLGLHIGAILFYLWRKRLNLVRPMILGDKAIDVPAESSRDDMFSRALAVLVLILCVGLVLLMLKFAP